nr:endo-1,4-beta-xylanase [uncultured bacterium]
MEELRKSVALFDEQRDVWGKRAAEGIEANRKGDMRITVRDAKGCPVKGAQVKVEQKNHAFRFGANLFMLDELETEEKNEKYKQYFANLLNMATVPFYWDTLEPEEGKPRYAKDSPKIYRRPAIDLCIEFCEKHGIEPREHALAYDRFFPEWLKKRSIPEVKKALEKRFAEISERYAAKIPTIEVTNEMNWKFGQTAFYDDPEFLPWCYDMAEKYFPNNHIAINEATGHIWDTAARTTNGYYGYTKRLLDAGKRIDAIGLQYHLHRHKEGLFDATRLLLNPEYIYRHLDVFASLGKPLQLTEITVPAYAWAEENEIWQADLLENLYTIWFSHPATEQIVYWNLVDGYAHVWDPALIKGSQGNMTLGENYYHGGLLRFDLSPKPVYFRLKELIEKRWHTEERAQTDLGGVVALRGFYGDYEIEITASGKTQKHTVSLVKGGKKDFAFVL